jgi:AraC-like DNA-binding protein
MLPHFLYAGRFQGSNVQFHRHYGHELVWVTDGECHVRLGSQRLFGKAGTVFVVPQGLQHNQEAKYVCTSFVVFQTPETHFDATPRTLEIGLDTPARRWLDDLYYLNMSPNQSSPAVTGALILALVEYLKGTETNQSVTPLHPALEEALRWMQSHLDTTLKIPELVAHTHFSASHLSELFHRQFGCGPHGYHQKLRLEHASRLLNNPYLRVAEVGQLCGYQDANYFTRQFQRHHGVSPVVFRRKNGKASL